ncbi:MAG: hypothetical protein AB7S93_18300 [Xanthobacteraceae bacterium]
MSSFTTRVELHDADWSDYAELHKAMGRQGFSQFITSDDGQTYELPPAEYDYSGNVTQSQVLEKAKLAAATTKKSFGVLVTKSAGRTWTGLRLAKRAA